MALVVLLGLGLYAFTQRPANVPDFNKPAPKNPLALPPLNRYHPSANDVIRPPSFTYNPMKIGYSDPIRAANVKSAYPQEKHLSDQSLDSPYPLYKTQKYRDIYVQQQTANWPLHNFLDNNFKNKGVKPQQAIRSLGNPQYVYVPPVTRSPV